jgi:adenosine/AMP kinase
MNFSVSVCAAPDSKIAASVVETLNVDDLIQTILTKIPDVKVVLVDDLITTILTKIPDVEVTLVVKNESRRRQVISKGYNGKFKCETLDT